MSFGKLVAFSSLLFCVAGLSFSLASEDAEATSDEEPIDLSLFIDGIRHWGIFSTVRDYERYQPSEFEGIAEQLIRFQNEDGGWPKNIDWLGKLDPAELREKLVGHHWESSLDNRNTYAQIRYLSEAYELSGNERYRESALRGVHYILDNQNPSGGWRGADVDAITFNDDVMVGVMRLLHDISTAKPPFVWIDADLREACKLAFDQALEVTLACQVPINGIKTAWGQQHDHVTLKPVKARSYELPAVTAMESSGVVEFLMSLEHPSQEVKNAITSAVMWFRQAAIIGYGYVSVPVPERDFHQTKAYFDRVFLKNENAPPVWARFYDLETGKPFICKRDGTIVEDFKDLSYERRVGYDWYGFWPEEVFKIYPEWMQKHYHVNPVSLPDISIPSPSRKSEN